MGIISFPGIPGCDYGSVDDNRHVDFAAAHAAGIRFVGRKVSEYLYADADFAVDWKNAGDAGMARIAYMFPRVGPERASAAKQVAVAKATLEAAGGLADSDFPVCLDVEFPSGRLPDIRSACCAAITDLVHELRTAFGYWPMIYSSARVVDGSDLDALNGGLPAELAMCPLWVKTGYRLAARRPVDQVKPPSPRLPRAWSLAPTAGAWTHQYQGDAVGIPGFTSSTDMDLFLMPVAGETGPRAAWIQKMIGAPITSALDAATIDAIKTFQAAHGLDADGVVGPATFARLARENK